MWLRCVTFAGIRLPSSGWRWHKLWLMVIILTPFTDIHIMAPQVVSHVGHFSVWLSRSRDRNYFTASWAIVILMLRAGKNAHIAGKVKKWGDCAHLLKLMLSVRHPLLISLGLKSARKKEWLTIIVMTAEFRSQEKQGWHGFIHPDNIHPDLSG